MQIESYQDLIVWQKGMDLAEECYKLSRSFPKEEMFGLTSQIRRAAVSIPANIAEDGTRDNRGVHSVSADRARKHEGTGDALVAESTSGVTVGRSSTTGHAVGRGGVADDNFPDWFFAAQEEVGPDSLVPHSLLAEKALLSLKVCDPAVGSGHFLVGAAHRLARHLSRVRAWAQGDSEPSPILYQHALRDVIGRCLYGVDINPMSAELCRVSLWLEALEPGKPLSFLEHHIQVGNSLLGTTPALLNSGIPDDAFTPIEGDVKTRVTSFKKQNKKEREEYKKGQGYLFDVPIKLGNLGAALAEIDQTPDDTATAVMDKARRYAEFVKGSEYQYGRLLADTWCAAFVWKKDDSDLGKLCPTERDFRKVESHAAAGLLPHVRTEVERLSSEYQFFHWHLAFPDVFRLPGKDESPENEPTGWSGGFDVMLGNPPWERVNIEARQFFAIVRPDIAEAITARRRKLIEELETSDPGLFRRFAEIQRQAATEIGFFQNSGLYPRLNQARLNTYVLFTEIAARVCSLHGRVGIIVPSGIATDEISRNIFAFLIQHSRIVSLWDFENREGLFPAIDSRMKFCLLTLRGGPHPSPPSFAFFLHSIEDLYDTNRRWPLSASELAELSPISGLCPTFRRAADKENRIDGLQTHAHFHRATGI